MVGSDKKYHYPKRRTVWSSPLLESTLGLFFQLVFYYIARKFLRIFFDIFTHFFTGIFCVFFVGENAEGFAGEKSKKSCYNFIFINDLRNIFF